MQPINASTKEFSAIDQGLREHMVALYRVLGTGLLATAASAWVTTETGLREILIGSEGLTGLGYVFLFAPVVLLLVAGLGIGGRNLKTVYWLFVLLQGPGLALALNGVSQGSVINAAAAAAAMFGAASLYGYTSRRDLTSMGAFMFMGLVGLVIASIINLFLASTALDWALSCIAVVVFTGLTAWDTQRIKEAYDLCSSEDDLANMRYGSALRLYLNVLNLFLAILSFGRKE